MSSLARAALTPLTPLRPVSTRDARFERARALPRYQAAMTFTPALPAHAGELLAPIAMGGFGLFFFPVFLRMAPPLMFLFGVLFAVAWYGFIWAMAARAYVKAHRLVEFARLDV